MDDSELLQRYANTGCQDAFGQLVSRYIDFVYASARRLTRDAHLAEDVTQGVFIVLARKASRVRSGAVLPAWLHGVTRNMSANLVKTQLRRRHYEQEAAVMKSVSQNEHEAFGEDDRMLAATLDDALSRLGTKDRGAVVMRYLQGKSVHDVATAMQISEEAARKRVSRAVDRLREQFQRRGVSLDDSGMISGLTRQTQQVAPATLASAVAAKSLSSAAGSASLLTKAVSWVTSAKVAAAACICFVASVGAIAVVQSGGASASAKPQATTQAAPLTVALIAPQMWQPYVPSDAPGTDVLKIANSELLGSAQNIPEYFGGLDDKVHRADGPPAASVRSLSPAPKKGGRVGKQVDVTPFRGKRIRLSAYLKTQDVAQQSWMALWVNDAKGYALAQDDMGGHWLTGNNDWTRCDIVEDVSNEADNIVVLAGVNGAGAIWIDGMQIDVVDPKVVPVNDCHRWRSWTPFPTKYITTFDEKEQRNGHGTIRVSAASANKFDWNCYDHTIDDVTPYQGKRVKMSVMIKAQDVTNSAGPQIRIVGLGNSTAKMDEQISRRAVKGSPDWLRYSTFINVPKDAMGMSFGVQMYGPGTIWIDDVKLEVVGGN